MKTYSLIFLMMNTIPLFCMDTSKAINVDDERQKITTTGYALCHKIDEARRTKNERDEETFSASLALITNYNAMLSDKGRLERSNLEMEHVRTMIATLEALESPALKLEIDELSTTEPRETRGLAQSKFYATKRHLTSAIINTAHTLSKSLAETSQQPAKKP